MCDLSDPELRAAVEDIKNDGSDTNWILFGYEGKKTIALVATGTGGHEELSGQMVDDQPLYALLRMEDGDQESRRVKFVFITWVGESVGGMAKGRVTIHKTGVAEFVGQFHVELRAENLSEMSETIIRKKLKVAGGADYDTGSNKGGYQSSGSIKQRALENYSAKEAEGNIGPVVYETSALPQTTPVDLGVRNYVAPPSEARKNMTDNVLDREKFQGKASTLSPTATAPAATAVMAAPEPEATEEPDVVDDASDAEEEEEHFEEAVDDEGGFHADAAIDDEAAAEVFDTDADDMAEYFASEEFNNMATAIFEEQDTDGSGFMEADEVAVIINELYQDLAEQKGIEARELTGEEMAELMERFDDNGDGKISRDEFTNFFRFIVLQSESA